jgi:small subunit ribosomal protein S9
MAAERKIITTSGKRKTATARAVVKKGTGVVRVNKKPLAILEPEIVQLKISEPVLIAGNDIIGSINIDVDVKGGGIMGQAEAVRCAIARGIITYTNDMTLREAYLSHDRNMLVNDIRLKESKKYGGRGARAKFQKSYR